MALQTRAPPVNARAVKRATRLRFYPEAAGGLSIVRRRLGRRRPLAVGGIAEPRAGPEVGMADEPHDDPPEAAVRARVARRVAERVLRRQLVGDARIDPFQLLDRLREERGRAGLL